MARSLDPSFIRPPPPSQVITTPYGTNFDHLRIADESQFKFDRALRVLSSDAASLPVYGVGHGLGSVIHLLISARYAVSVSATTAAEHACHKLSTPSYQRDIPWQPSLGS